MFLLDYGRSIKALHQDTKVVRQQRTWHLVMFVGLGDDRVTWGCLCHFATLVALVYVHCWKKSDYCRLMSIAAEESFELGEDLSEKHCCDEVTVLRGIFAIEEKDSLGGVDLVGLKRLRDDPCAIIARSHCELCSEQ